MREHAPRTQVRRLRPLDFDKLFTVDLTGEKTLSDGTAEAGDRLRYSRFLLQIQNFVQLAKQSFSREWLWEHGHFRIENSWMSKPGVARHVEDFHLRSDPGQLFGSCAPIHSWHDRIR